MLKFLILALTPILLVGESFVTYEFSGGRFGDNLLSYLHAKWIAHQHQIPLLYKPFEHSSELMLSNLEKLFDPSNSYRIVPWPISSEVERVGSILYVCPYFPEDPWEKERLLQFRRWDVHWKDPAFRAEALAHIAPKQPLSLILPAPGKISVALHVREGGGYDGLKQDWPLKFPALDFYIKGLLKVIEITQGRPLFCQVFTDARHPDWIIQKLRAALPALPSIEFGYRKKKNRYNKNVLEDFFSLFHYDILIRPQSNYSIIPSLLHDYAICHYPTDCQKIGETFVISETRTDVEPELLQKILFEYN